MHTQAIEADGKFICRGCLKQGGEMKNMAECGLLEDFCSITSIMIEPSDCGSQWLCLKCEVALKSSASFRDQCRHCNMILLDCTVKDTKDEQQVIETSKYGTVRYVFTESELNVHITPTNPSSKVSLKCPLEDCTFTTLKKSNLLLHIQRNHAYSKNGTVKLHYYCPMRNCQYNVQSKLPKSFPEKKFLTQHTLKVHTHRTHVCESCKTRFPSETDLNRHIKQCGKVFPCNVCEKSYTNSDALSVHLMRKHPDLHATVKTQRRLERQKLPKRTSSTQTKKEATEIQTQTLDILTSDDDSMFLVALSDIQTQFPDQTDRRESIKETQTCFCLLDSPGSKYSNSTYTQTSEVVKTDVLLSCSAETQTCFDQDL